jgi:hypothetical protein
MKTSLLIFSVVGALGILVVAAISAVIIYFCTKKK